MCWSQATGARAAAVGTRTRATPDPNSAGQHSDFSGGNRALVTALDVRGSHWAAAREREEHYPLQTLQQHGQSGSVLLRDSTQAPRHCWENWRVLAQLAQHWTQISLHFHLLLSTCLLHLLLALKMKREANTNLTTFFRKAGINGNPCKQTSSE